jgi:hypothetical protein
VRTLEDTNHWVRSSACDALGKMGQKAETNELIEILLDAYFDKKFQGEYELQKAIESILTLPPDISSLKHDTVSRLSQFICQSEWYITNTVAADKFIKAFLDSKIVFWLPIIERIFIRFGYGFIVTENTITVYGTKDPVVLCCSNRQLIQQLQDYFINWLDKFS